MEELDLSELTEMVVEERKFLIREQGLPVLLTSEVEPGIKRRADETLYIRMLGNLISNVRGLTGNRRAVKDPCFSDGEGSMHYRCGGG